MRDLKPCPFCGGKASARKTYKGTFAVSCNRLCVGQYGYDTEEEAIEAWNTRKTEGAVVEELMKLRDRDKFGQCYKCDEILSCTMEISCRSCYEEIVREILQRGGKE